jgi:hypothetical protein
LLAYCAVGLTKPDTFSIFEDAFNQPDRRSRSADCAEICSCVDIRSHQKAAFTRRPKPTAKNIAEGRATVNSLFARNILASGAPLSGPIAAFLAAQAFPAAFAARTFLGLRVATFSKGPSNEPAPEAMTIRKNPDWHVWMGDALYWIRTPPGIYIFIILVLGTWLLGSLNKSAPPTTYSAPVYVTPASSPPQHALPVPHPPAVQSDGCPPGTLFVQHLNNCITGHRRTADIFVGGTKNNCPDDAVFIDRLGRCIPMFSVGTYRIFAGDVFYISGRRDAYVYVRSGQIRISNPAVNFDKFKYPSDRPTLIRVGAMITGVGDSSSIRVEFDATPH